MLDLETFVLNVKSHFLKARWTPDYQYRHWLEPSQLTIMLWHCTKRIRRDKVPALRTAMKQLFLLDELIVPSLCFGNLLTCIWFGITLPHIVDIFLIPIFIERFNCSIYTLEKVVVLINSEHVVIANRTHPSNVDCKAQHARKHPVVSAHFQGHDGRVSSCGRVAPLVMFEPYAQYPVLANKTFHRFLKPEP